jgi:hypothetical protein
MDPNEALLAEFTARYRRRITQAIPKYGEFDAATDKRILSEEAIEEALDVGSYMEFLEEKHPALARDCRRATVKAIALYQLLKKVKEKELALREEGGGE